MKFVGGRPCLDFVNTVAGWTDKIIVDKLERYEDLIRWGELAGATTPTESRMLAGRASRSRKEASAVLKRASTLRGAVREIFRSVIQERRPKRSDIFLLERELAVARSHQRLMHQDHGFEWAWEGRANALDSVLWVVSASATELLTSPDLARVRECGGLNCGWLFLDTSRNHSRHWCDMQDCGNRSKVRRFRQRNRES